MQLWCVLLLMGVLVQVAINRLHRLLAKGCDDMEYVYTRTGIAAPWICVKLLRLLQIYPAPDADR